jgi:hypothetical protein
MVDTFVAGLAYPSVETGTHVEAASTNVKHPLVFREDAEFDIPHSELKYSVQRLASSASPASINRKRVLNPQSTLRMKGVVADLMPFLLPCGTIATTTTEQFIVTQIDTGLPKKMLGHVEQNEFTTARVWDYTDMYCNKAKIFSQNKLLWADLYFLAGIATAGHQLTASPSAMFGANTPFEGYPLNHASNTVAWNSKALGAYFRDISFEIEPKIEMHEIQGTSVLKFQSYREVEYSPISLKFVIDSSAANDLDDIEALIDAATSSDLVVFLYRAAADYLKMTFKNCLCVKWKATPLNTKKGEFTYIDALFTPPVKGAGTSPIEIREKQATTNASANYDI